MNYPTVDLPTPTPIPTTHSNHPFQRDVFHGRAKVPHPSRDSKAASISHCLGPSQGRPSGGFLKWWVSPTNPWGFPTKMIILGWRLGVSPFKGKHPSHGCLIFGWIFFGGRKDDVKENTCDPNGFWLFGMICFLNKTPWWILKFQIFFLKHCVCSLL